MNQLVLVFSASLVLVSGSNFRDLDHHRLTKLLRRPKVLPMVGTRFKDKLSHLISQNTTQTENSRPIVLTPALTPGELASHMNHSARHISRRSLGSTHHCGAWINNTQGFIHTPNFPAEFPVPLRCTWVLNAPPGHQVVLYLTQFYLRQNLTVTEYDHYDHAGHHRGRQPIDTITFEHTVLRSYKPFLVISFNVDPWDLGTVSLRVQSYLLDVYGFNVTYEVIPEDAPERTDACSVVHCSFLGDCLVTADFSKYECHCFDDYFGPECQYGKFCDPERGTNMCDNGGKCRYYYGSKVNTCECPPAYEGHQCEIRREDFMDTVCASLNCSQTCAMQPHSTGHECSCLPGYRLLADNKTCEERGFSRYYVEIRLLGNTNNNTDFTCPSVAMDLKKIVDLALKDLLHENLTLVNLSRTTSGVTYLGFRFIGEESDASDVDFWLWLMVYARSVCGLKADPGYLFIDAQPAPHVLSVSNYDEHWSVEGRLLTLVCQAKGPDDLIFTWYKDGALLNISRTARNIWEADVPTYNTTTHLSVLNIEKAHYLDEGEYTCSVSELGLADAKSVHVTIIPTPHMEVSPMAFSTRPGGMVAIMCLSRDDETSTFEYVWTRNGKPLVMGDNREVIEELFPTGSRVHVRDIQVPAVYRCTVRSEAGETSETCLISILTDDGLQCNGELYKDVTWSDTPSGHQDVRPCPREAEGWTQSRKCHVKSCRKVAWQTGKATRRCTCNQGECRWGEPNFAKCTTIPIDVITQKFQTLALGFQTSLVEESLSGIRRSLHDQLDWKGYVMSGDLDRIMTLLVGIQHYVSNFENEENKPGLYESIFETLDMVIECALGITDAEHDDVILSSSLLRLIENTRRDTKTLTHLTNTSRMLDMKLDSHLGFADNLTLYRDDFVHAWIDMAYDNISYTLSTLVVNYHKAERLMVNRESGYFQNGRLFYFGVHDASGYLPRLYVTINQTHLTDVKGEQLNNTFCAIWDNSPHTVAHWSHDGCIEVVQGPTYTVCSCVLPGHYQVFSPVGRDQVVHFVPTIAHNHVTLLVSVAIGLCGFVTSFCIQIFTWRSGIKDHRFVLICFNLSLIGICGILVGGICHIDTVVVCVALQLTLYILLIVAVCSGLAISVSIFLCTSTTVFVFNLHTASRYVNDISEAIITLVIPVIAVIPLVCVGGVRGYSPVQGSICWMSFNDWEFLVLITTVSVLVLCTLLVAGVSFKNTILAQSLPQKKSRPRFRFFLSRCLIHQVLLSIIVTTCYFLHHNDDNIYEYILGLSIAILGLISACTTHPKIIVYIITLKLHKSQNQTSHCRKCSLQEAASSCVGDCASQCLPSVSTVTNMNNAMSESSFKTYVKPQYNLSSLAPMDSDIEQDKLTQEKKEQLMALLGQSSNESSKESHVTFNTTNTSLEEATDIVTSSPKSSTSRINSLLGFYRTKTRHNANSKCSCSKCGTMYPFKPARGRSFIVDENASQVKEEAERNIAKSLSYNDKTRLKSNSSGRRRSMPDPFPELIVSGTKQATRSLSEPVGETEAKQSEAILMDNNAQRVTFIIGSNIVNT